MTRKTLGTSHVPLSPAVRAGDFVYVSGQVPTVDGRIVGDDVAAQTRQVLDNIKAVLAEAGCTMADVVKSTVILKHASDFAAFNEAYAAYFPSEPPARTTLEANLMIDILVEIDVVAYRP
jgi:2-iminobutanoate/2-iminopropanoate deaminase